MNRIELPKIYPVASHTDNVGLGTTFVAIPGSCDNGNLYIAFKENQNEHTYFI